MKTKAFITPAILIAFIIFTLIPADSWAGSPQSHRWEGVAIGISAAIIGTALIQACRNAEASAYAPAAYHQRPPVPAGHWETRQAWVPPVSEKTWNPGHYNHQGRWIPGHWIQIETQAGYWTEQRVWVPGE